MKATIATLTCACLSFFGNCQLNELNTTSKTINPVQSIDPVSRYGNDYILKDYTFQNGDSTVLYKLNLDHLEQFRKTSESIDVTDPNTLLVVTLFGKTLMTPPENNISTED